jgi:hypothetical protein
MSGGTYLAWYFIGVLIFYVILCLFPDQKNLSRAVNVGYAMIWSLFWPLLLLFLLGWVMSIIFKGDAGV